MRRSKKFRRLTLESLEQRQLLAVDVVMFNDQAGGPAKHPNATTYAGNGTASGLLKDVATGANTDITLATTANGATYENTSGIPAAGTPAANVFNGYVDFSTSTGSSLAVAGAQTYTHALSGLDPANRYDFAGSAVRGSTGCDG